MDQFESPLGASQPGEMLSAVGGSAATHIPDWYCKAV